MADDVAGLIHYLQIEKADLMGFSVGGDVALRTAIQHPELVRKLVIVSATFSRDGWYPEIVAGMTQMGAATAEQMKQTPMYQSYAIIAPKPEDWPVLQAKLGAMFRKDYDWSKDVPAIKAPVRWRFRCCPHCPCRSSSLSSLAGVRRTEAGMDRACPTPGWPFYPA